MRAPFGDEADAAVSGAIAGCKTEDKRGEGEGAGEFLHLGVESEMLSGGGKRGEFGQIQFAGVDGHADGRVDVQALEGANVIEGGDTAGRSDFEVGGGAEAGEP